jgi:hypothetical protein
MLGSATNRASGCNLAGAHGVAPVITLESERAPTLPALRLRSPSSVRIESRTRLELFARQLRSVFKFDIGVQTSISFARGIPERSMRTLEFVSPLAFAPRSSDSSVRTWSRQAGKVPAAERAATARLPPSSRVQRSEHG